MKLKILAGFILVAIGSAARAGEFAIHDNDTVVFLGDSITAEGTYGKIVENYTLLRYPDRKVHFINAGWGGDTAAGGLARLERDVFARGATVLTVAYGINDIGWGGKADSEHRQKYLDSIRGIVEQCKAHHVRVFICSAAVTGADPDKSENDYLQKMCDDGMAIARDLGESAIDIERTMRQIQHRIKESNLREPDVKKHETLHVGDGIHLNDLGQLAMAFAIIKGLGAPQEVSSVNVDAGSATLTSSSGCTVSNIKATGNGVEFDRLDAGLPYNAGLFSGLKHRFIPIPDEINHYMLTVSGLSAGRYDLSVNGRAVGTFKADDLAKGINIASATADGWVPGGPWEAQAWALTPLTDARFNLFASRKMSDTYNADNPNLAAEHEQAVDVNSRLELLQRQTAAPTPYHFVLKLKTN